MGTAVPDHRFLQIRLAVELQAASRCFRISPRISAAAAGMLVPGPKIALTPARFRKSQGENATGAGQREPGMLDGSRAACRTAWMMISVSFAS